MQVCDKCRKNGVMYVLKVKGVQAELCDACSQKIIEWLKKEDKAHPLSGLFGGK